MWLEREAAVVASASIALATRALASEAGLESFDGVWCLKKKG